MARPIAMSTDEYRQHIVNTAEKIVLIAGANQLSIRALAREAGTSVTQMYRKGIAGIEDVIFMLNEKGLDLLIDHVAKIDLSSMSGETALKQIAGVYLSFSDPQGDYYPLWELMQRLNTNQAESPSDYQQKTAQLFGYGEQAMHKALPLLTAKKLSEATRVLWASVHGVCHLHARDKLVSTGKSPVKPMIDLLIHAFLKGLEKNK